MGDMAYCGYAEFLIVIMFIRLMYLILILGGLLIILIINSCIFIVRFKIRRLGDILDWELLFTIWRLLFLIIVLVIRRRVLIFSIAYINRIRVRNFIFLYVRFIVRIVWLVLNNNFYWIIFGWDGLGVVSFLLIVYYINNERILNGLYTLFQNRLGDIFFVLFILGRLNLLIWNNRVVSIGLLVLVIGSCVKRAQFPFNTWLLAAIRAPTPISSLVHSSTLVVAGVYILLQFSYCLGERLNFLKWVRVLTLIIRRFGLINEGDIKKLIAYSTIRHVALIIYMIRFGLFKIVYFHLNIHAIFKSLMFICFGFVILSSYHRQDKRIVTYSNLNPLIKIIYIFSCFCLAGLPFIRGFFSKDLIIEKIIERSLNISYLVLLLLFLSLRIYYSLKLLKLHSILFSYRIVEKNYLGIGRIIMILIVIIFFINIYLSLVFSLRLEFLSFKLRIYLWIFLFGFLRILRNLNYKLVSYSKVSNWKEIWLIKLSIVDCYVYWNIFILINQLILIRKIKIFLVANWWVIVILVWFFCEKSFKSVTSKKSRI